MGTTMEPAVCSEAEITFCGGLGIIAYHYICKSIERQGMKIDMLCVRCVVDSDEDGSEAIVS